MGILPNKLGVINLTEGNRKNKPKCVSLREIEDRSAKDPSHAGRAFFVGLKQGGTTSPTSLTLEVVQERLYEAIAKLKSNTMSENNETRLGTKVAGAHNEVTCWCGKKGEGNPCDKHYYSL